MNFALGQRPGLVGAQHIDAAERLDGSGVADQGAAQRQAPGAGELGHGREQGQAFGHGGDGQRHA